MKKLIWMMGLLLIIGCAPNESPEPRWTNIKSVSVAGPLTKKLGDEASLYFMVENIPTKSGWSMLYKIDGNVVHSIPIPRDHISYAAFHRYTTVKTGRHEFEGCITNGNSEVCEGTIFFVND